MEADPGDGRSRLIGRLTWFLLGLIVVIAALTVAWVILQWSIAEAVYSAKAGLDWFGITFYHDYSFVAAALFALLLIYPRPGGSDLWRLASVLYRRARPYDGEEDLIRVSEKMNVWLWALWQTLKWAIGFYSFVVTGGFFLLGGTMNPIMMAVMGLGGWADVPRVFILPLVPSTGSGLIDLMPTMQIQYAIISYVLSAFLLVFAVRMVLRLLANLTTRRSEVWLMNLLAVIAAILLEVILTAPYWLMNIATPYLYGIVWSGFILTLVGFVHLTRRNAPIPRTGVFKGIAVVLAIVLVIQVGIGAFYYFNWNNNYLNYQWYPQTQKQITVTRWAAGLNGIQVSNISSLPTSNPTTTLNLVRQWDQTAASVTNTKEIGAYNWMGLASSEIVYYNGTEYWVSPTTPTFPSTDWISQHLIYTHAAKVLVINTHNGSVIPATSAYGIPSEPLIYYGEGAGFGQDVYVHVPGYDEVQNVSYPGTPDYTLSGWQKSMWFTFSEGQLGFAFSSQSIQMLWNRNIFSRVGDVLIPGLTMDPSAYIVSDGKNLYYAVQVYIDYPLQSGFAASPYLRFFGVVLVNIQDGSLQGYTVSSLLGTNKTDFITKFYQNYYSSWSSPPAWLIPQLRYPEQLLGTPTVPGQLDYDFVYHVSDPFVFRSGTQFYERPANSTVQYIPFAVGNRTYFVGLQLVQYQGVVSKNLGALYIAYGGDKLGQIDLYQNPSQASVIIGPSAAENALNTSPQVRTQFTLLSSPRIGSYLLYSVGGILTYFVAVYTNPGTAGVVTQLAFMTAINPATGTVAVGSNAAAAFTTLSSGSQPPIVKQNEATTVHQIDNLITSQGYALVNASQVNPAVWINVGTVSYSAVGANATMGEVAGLLKGYGQGSVGMTVYAWLDASGNLNFGVFKVPSQGLTELYYVTIKP
ncbi:MAG TPA: hypothetical protein VLY21_03840 [Nitrososphaerales archaeon]|nr:hypothetical protein [Nitrososphaerales archaeon]